MLITALTPPVTSPSPSLYTSIYPVLSNWNPRLKKNGDLGHAKQWSGSYPNRVKAIGNLLCPPTATSATSATSAAVPGIHQKTLQHATKYPSTPTWSRFTNVAVAKIATNCNKLQQFPSSSSIQQYCWNFTLPKKL